MTSQCFCMNKVSGRDGCIARLCTQCPTSASGSGMPPDCSPLLMAVQLPPPSSLRKAPAAEMAVKIRCLSVGCSRIVCRHMPPAPGCQWGPDPWVRRPDSSVHDAPPSVDVNSAASSTPA